MTWKINSWKLMNTTNEFSHVLIRTQLEQLQSEILFYWIKVRIILPQVTKSTVITQSIKNTKQDKKNRSINLKAIPWQGAYPEIFRGGPTPRGGVRVFCLIFGRGPKKFLIQLSISRGGGPPLVTHMFPCEP